MIPVEIVGLQFRPVERRIVEKLCDGMPHSLDSLKDCLWDEEAEVYSTVQNHISLIRKRLAPSSYRICTEQLGGALCYRLTRLLIPARI